MKRILPLLLLVAGCGGDGASSTTKTSDGGTVTTTPANAMLTVDDADFEFDPVIGDSQTLPAQFNITNTGGKPSGQLTVDINGNDSYAFTIVTDTCSHEILVPGASCQVAASLTSPYVGALEADLRVTGEPGGVAKVHLHGNVEVTTLVVTPIAFGGVVQGTTSAPVIVTVTNGGGVATGAITIMPPSDAQFAVGEDLCSGKSLDSDRSCTLTIVYTPTADAGAPATSALGVSTAAAGNIATPVTGEPLASATMAIADYDFGAYGMHFGPFPAHTLTVRNSGYSAGTVSEVALGQGAASAFQISADHCTGQTIAPGATCNVDVQPRAQTVAGSTADILTVLVDSGHAGQATLTAVATVDYITTLITLVLGGSVTSSDGQSCSSYQCTFYWPLNPAPVTLTETPSTSFPFYYWSGTFCNDSSNESCTFTPTNGSAITAEF